MAKRCNVPTVTLTSTTNYQYDFHQSQNRLCLQKDLQSSIEIARKMLNLLDVRTISQITGLSINEREPLKASNL
ncbi:hypothetical protein PseudUWO311_17170 [Pseudanabaena sp. UWO311]|nr:hypothetical protein PseudUWO311_17170 [Pseudanabaena sp. UWO311]